MAKEPDPSNGIVTSTTYASLDMSFNTTWSGFNPWGSPETICSLYCHPFQGGTALARRVRILLWRWRMRPTWEGQWFKTWASVSFSVLQRGQLRSVTFSPALFLTVLVGRRFSLAFNANLYSPKLVYFPEGTQWLLAGCCEKHFAASCALTSILWIVSVEEATAHRSSA